MHGNLTSSEIESLAVFIHGEMSRTGKGMWRVRAYGRTCWARYGHELIDLRACFLLV